MREGERKEGRRKDDMKRKGGKEGKKGGRHRLMSTWARASEDDWFLYLLTVTCY